MKKYIYFLILLITSFGVVSCDDGSDGPEDGMIWDIYPTGVHIILVDNDGNNLLDPAVEGNWVGEEMVITNDGTSYYIDWEFYAPKTETRAYLAHFDGLIWYGGAPWIESKYNNLYFGEFNGDDDLDMSLSFAITTLNRVYDFKFTNHFYWKKHQPHRDTHIFYDGKDIEGKVLKLVVPHNPNYKQPAN